MAQECGGLDGGSPSFSSSSSSFSSIGSFCWSAEFEISASTNDGVDDDDSTESADPGRGGDADMANFLEPSNGREAS